MNEQRYLKIYYEMLAFQKHGSLKMH